MKKVLLVVMCLSIIAGIVAMVWGLSERARSRRESEAALRERDAMADERDKALGELDAERILRRAAEVKQVKAEDIVTQANEELAEVSEPVVEKNKTVAFFEAFDTIFFACLDGGDDYYAEGLTRFSEAKSGPDKQEALNLIKKAKKKYLEAQDRLKKLEGVNDETKEIVALVLVSTENKTAGVRVMQDYLDTALAGQPDTSKQQEAEKQQAEADSLVINVCQTMVELIEDVCEKGDLTEVQLSHIEDLKDKIEEWLEEEE